MVVECRCLCEQSSESHPKLEMSFHQRHKINCASYTRCIDNNWYKRCLPGKSWTTCEKPIAGINGKRIVDFEVVLKIQDEGGYTRYEASIVLDGVEYVGKKLVKCRSVSHYCFTF